MVPFDKRKTMKKLQLALLILLLPVCTLFAMEGRVTNKFPNQVEISWTAEKKASFYDIYLGSEGVKRLPSTQTTTSIGSNEDPLASCGEYQAIVAARDEKNNTLSFVQIPFSTTSWEGRYRWKNTTGNDNDGKCRELLLVVKDEGKGVRIFGDFGDNGLVLLFPLFAFASDYPTVGFWDEDPIACAYRMNATVFNTTSFSPKSWKIKSMETTASSVSTVVETVVSKMRFTTESTFRFQVSLDRKKQVVLSNRGKGIASWGMFQCPDKNSGGDFLFICY
jgi:hypothetical protein